MKFNRRLCVAAIATLATSFTLTACSDSGSSSDTYKIGMLVALSGPSAQAGQHQRDGAEAAVDQINKDDAGQVVKSGRASEMSRDDIARAYMGAGE